MEPDEEKEMFGLQQTLIEAWRSSPREPVTGAAADREPRS
jgi:probable rRNA maturation factor